MKKYLWIFGETIVTAVFVLNALIAFDSGDRIGGWSVLWLAMLWWRANFNEWRIDFLAKQAGLKS